MLKIHTKPELEVKIAELDNWLNHFTPAHYLYNRKKQAHNYYISKLIELEENNVNVIRA